jgi:hypothetical protein
MDAEVQNYNQKFLNHAEYDSWRNIRQSFPIVFIRSVHDNLLVISLTFFILPSQKEIAIHTPHSLLNEKCSRSDKETKNMQVMFTNPSL